MPGFNLVLVKANRGQRELRGLRPLQLPEAGLGAGDHQGVPRHGVLYSTVKAFRQLDGSAQFQQLILISHASFTVEDFKSLNERLKPKPVNAAEY